jgi:hypothetical protein
MKERSSGIRVTLRIRDWSVINAIITTTFTRRPTGGCLYKRKTAGLVTTKEGMKQPPVLSQRIRKYPFITEIVSGVIPK